MELTKEKIQALYKQKILPESKAPFNFEKPERFTKDLEAYNPMCGDQYHLYFQEKEHPEHFHGFGCAVSKASTSLLVKKTKGMSKQEVESLVSGFLIALEGEKVNLNDEELELLVALKDFGGRLDCITLTWKTLLNDIQNAENEN